MCHQADDNPPLSQYNQLTVCGEIVSVIYDEHHKCPFCDWKMCTEISQDIIKCTNCSAKFKMSKAKKQSMAKLHNNGEMHKLKCFIIFFLHCSTSNYPVRQLKNISYQWTISKSRSTVLI